MIVSSAGFVVAVRNQYQIISSSNCEVATSAAFSSVPAGYGDRHFHSIGTEICLERLW